MNAVLEATFTRSRELFRPPPRLSLADWADAKFVLPPGDANAGRWRTLPYQRGIMEAISDPEIERVTFMKSARVGWTKMFCAAVGYFAEHDPAQILVVQPTIDDAQKHSKEDIAPVFRDVPALRGIIAEPKARGSENTILDKQFKGGALTLVGANSARGFRRTSRRIVIFDEVDAYPPSAGEEGDQIELAIRRSEYYWNRKILAGSTPTNEIQAGRSRIEVMFEEGDQRRYYVPCPHCGAFQVLRFENLKWPDGPPSAHFVCVENGCVIEHASKRAMIEAGEWRAEKPEHFTESHRWASFHLWAAYSYSPNATWADIADEWVRAAHGGDIKLKTVKNTVLGEVWTEDTEAPDWEALMRRRELYPIGTCPPGVLFLTCGVDVQKNRLVYEVVGWARGKTTWSVDFGVLVGDTADLTAGPWPQLAALLERAYPHALGHAELRIQRMCVDSGYNTQHVYAWARQYPMSRVLAIKGAAYGPALVGPPTPVELSARGKRLKRGYAVWTVVGAHAKRELYRFLNLQVPVDGSTPPPGFCHFPEYGEDYFKQLTGEQEVQKKTHGFPRFVWEMVPGRENHALDARVYARAAAQVYGIDRFTETDWQALEASVTPPGAPTPAPTVPSPPPPTASRPARAGWLGQQRTGWLRA